MKITTTKVNRKNLVVQIGNHSIKFDENLQAEVEDSIVEELISEDSSITLEVDQTTSVVSEEATVSEATVVESTGTNTLEETTSTDIDLEQLSVKDLQEVCVSLDIDEKQYKNLKKPELIKFIQSLQK